MAGILNLLQQVIGASKGWPSTMVAGERVPVPMYDINTGQIESYPAPAGGTPPIKPPMQWDDGELPALEHQPTEPQAANVPVPGSDGPSVAVPASEATPARKRGGLLGALESVFAPDPGSFWWGVMNNDNGIFGAKGAQQAYAQGQRANELALAEKQQKLARGDVQVLGNNALLTKPDGTREWISPPQQPALEERLLDRYLNSNNPAEKETIRTMLRGYGYSPEVIERKAAAQRATNEERARSNAKYRAPPKGATKLPPLPPGFKIKN